VTWTSSFVEVKEADWQETPKSLNAKDMGKG
jgi:hypothetical protein